MKPCEKPKILSTCCLFVPFHKFYVKTTGEVLLETKSALENDTEMEKIFLMLEFQLPGIVIFA